MLRRGNLAERNAPDGWIPALTLGMTRGKWNLPFLSLRGTTRVATWQSSGAKCARGLDSHAYARNDRGVGHPRSIRLRLTAGFPRSLRSLGMTRGKWNLPFCHCEEQRQLRRGNLAGAKRNNYFNFLMRARASSSI